MHLLPPVIAKEVPSNLCNREYFDFVAKLSRRALRVDGTMQLDIAASE